MESIINPEKNTGNQNESLKEIILKIKNEQGSSDLGLGVKKNKYEFLLQIIYNQLIKPGYKFNPKEEKLLDYLEKLNNLCLKEDRECLIEYVRKGNKYKILRSRINKR